MMDDVDQHYLRMAHIIARTSPDPSTQNGAVIAYNRTTVSAGCNEYPRGVIPSPERLERPLKYSVIEHAERNAIYSARDCTDCTMYALWAACADCARAIIQSNITTLVTHEFYTLDEHRAEHWDESIDIAFIMLREAGVEVRISDAEIYPDMPLRYNGELVYY